MERIPISSWFQIAEEEISEAEDSEADDSDAGSSDAGSSEAGTSELPALYRRPVHRAKIIEPVTIDMVSDLRGDDAASLVQSWLFFGLLAEFFQQRVDPQDFVDFKGDLQPVIIIKDHVVDKLYQTRYSQVWKQGRKQRLATIARMRRHLHVCGLRVEFFDDPALANDEPSLPAIILSVKLLTVALTRIAGSFTQRPSSALSSWFYQNRLMRFWKFIYSLSKLRRSQFQDPGDDLQASRTPPLRPDCASPLPSAQLLIDRLVGNGWCLPQALQICRSHDYSVVNYLSFLRQRARSHVSHATCMNASKCVANNVQLDDSYVTRHVNEDCQCELRHVSKAQLVGCILEGSIPIVCLETDTAEITIVKWNPSMDFTAISHVWSDGLGNPSANALPWCQLRQLGNFIRFQNIDESKWHVRMIASVRGGYQSGRQRLSNKKVLFWMDTLCIPVQRHNSQAFAELKANAIDQMALIYASASQVLVLDSGLAEIESTTASDGSTNDDEIAAHILCSAWMTRAWTLQEGVLARSRRFQLLNTSRIIGFETRSEHSLKMNSQSLARSFSARQSGMLRLSRYEDDHPPRPPSDPLMGRLCKFSDVLFDTVLYTVQDYKSLRYQSYSKSWQATQIARAWNAIIGRSTTQPKDRHAIFANVLDFNAYHIRQIQDDHRVPAILLSCKELPLSLLYNRGPRLRNYRFPQNGWIPTETVGDPLVGRGTMKMTEDGLLLDFSKCTPFSTALLLSYPSIPRVNHFRIKVRGRNEHLFIEVQDDSHSAAPAAAFEEASATMYENGNGTCIILDATSRSSPRSGYIAKGARFSIHGTLLKYDKPLMAGDVKGWASQILGDHPAQIYTTGNCHSGRKFYLDYGK
jgi:hypothetical protein